jgi:hypothetical protein
MSDIQRYDAWPQESPFEDKNGEFVTYEDHIKIVKELEAKLAMAVEALQTFKHFDDLPLECKRPDAFQIKVRKPILVALAKLKGEGE